MLKPIISESVPDKIANAILELISKGELKTGDALPSERKLSEMFKVSRASIREALKYLELTGVIETSQGKRTLLKNITEDLLQKPLEVLLSKDEKKIIELTKVRTYLEAYGAKDAAIFRTEKDILKLEKIIELMENDFAKGIINFRTDFNFHITVATATKNLIYIHIIETVHNLIGSSLKFYREVVFTSHDSQNALLNQHKKIFTCIKEKAPHLAEQAMKEHLEYVLSEYSKTYLK